MPEADTRGKCTNEQQLEDDDIFTASQLDGLRRCIDSLERSVNAIDQTMERRVVLNFKVKENYKRRRVPPERNMHSSNILVGCLLEALKYIDPPRDTPALDVVAGLH